MVTSRPIAKSQRLGEPTFPVAIDELSTLLRTPIHDRNHRLARQAERFKRKSSWSRPNADTQVLLKPLRNQKQSWIFDYKKSGNYPQFKIPAEREKWKTEVRHPVTKVLRRWPAVWTHVYKEKFTGTGIAEASPEENIKYHRQKDNKAAAGRWANDCTLQVTEWSIISRC